MSKPILIIGCSRSGTSLLARILASSGIFMGADVESNHESRSIQAANKWIFLNAEASFDDPADGIDRLWADVFLRTAVVSTIQKTLFGKYSWPYWHWRMFRPDRPWGFKDPRLTYTLPFWLEVVPEARVIHIRRNMTDVIESLTSRRARVEAKWMGVADFDGVNLLRAQRPVANAFAADRARCRGHWMRYVNRASAHVERLGPTRAIELAYEDLISEPARELSRLAAFLDHPLAAWRPDPTGITNRLTAPRNMVRFKARGYHYAATHEARTRIDAGDFGHAKGHPPE